MLKHSENHSVPHNKFVYLSEDQKSICWKSLDKEDEKRIDLKAITRVVKEGAENHLKSLTVKNILRCVIIFS